MNKVSTFFLLVIFGCISTTAIYAKPSPKEVKQTLDRHNAIRKAHYSSNALAWSDTLAASAQRHADYLARTNTFAHSGSRYGENLYEYSTHKSMVDAVNAWYGEKRKFDPHKRKCNGAWYECGHYTQLIWKSTKKVGCGKSSGTKWKTIVVCQYDPPGNYQGMLPY
jgi:pathogenesis-related protein 1